MTTTAMLLKEIEAMPDEIAAKVLDFAIFIKSKHIPVQPPRMAIKEAFGIFKGINTHFEREENDRV